MRERIRFHFTVACRFGRLVGTPRAVTFPRTRIDHPGKTLPKKSEGILVSPSLPLLPHIFFTSSLFTRRIDRLPSLIFSTADRVITTMAQHQQTLQRSATISTPGFHKRPATAGPSSRRSSALDAVVTEPQPVFLGQSASSTVLPLHHSTLGRAAGRRASWVNVPKGSKALMNADGTRKTTHSGFEQSATENLEDLARFMLPIVQAMRNHQIVGLDRPWLYQSAADSTVVTKKDLQQLVGLLLHLVFTLRAL
jgi:hypothetical protein